MGTVLRAIGELFPLKMRWKKSTDLPWMSSKAKKQIERRKRLCVEEGGIWTDAWNDAKKKKTNEIILECKWGYFSTQGISSSR